jgi:NitT/TauT family transport system substrate-binding protein
MYVRGRMAACLVTMAVVALVAACAGPAAAGAGPAAGGAAAAPAGGAPAVAATPRPIEKVGYTLPARGTDYLFAAVADKRGFFTEEGLDVTWEQASSTVGVTAVVAGQYDFTGSVGSSQGAIVGGAPLKVVMVAQEHPAYGFFAKPPIAAVRDLKGKNLGVTTAGSAAHLLANLVMEKHGLNPEQDVTWVQLRQPQNLWVALQTGIVDASMIGSADLHRPRKEGFVDLGIYKDPDARNASSGLTTSDRLLREQPDKVKRMVRALIKGIQYMKAYKAETVPIMVEFLEMPADEAPELYDLTMDAFSPQGYVSDDTLQRSVDVLAAGMELKETPAVAQIFDLRLAREAYAELQREGWKP